MGKKFLFAHQPSGWSGLLCLNDGAPDNRLFGWKLIHDDDAASGKAPLEQFAKTANRNLRVCARARAMVKEDPLLLGCTGPGIYALAEKSIDDNDLQIAFVDVTGLTTKS
jgi:hypothetical protein